MRCPVCDATLRAVHKHNVEIDICPDCKGVWLDRGELEKIIALDTAGGPERARDPYQEPRDPRPRESEPRYAEARRPPEYSGDRREHGEHPYAEHDSDRRPADSPVHYDKHGRPYRKKRESWFGELFDIFD
jgi:Zn-finger nucleic acid-binding protein